jgi:hypothetical protein
VGPSRDACRRRAEAGTRGRIRLTFGWDLSAGCRREREGPRMGKTGSTKAERQQGFHRSVSAILLRIKAVEREGIDRSASLSILAVLPCPLVQSSSKSTSTSSWNLVRDLRFVSSVSRRYAPFIVSNSTSCRSSPLLTIYGADRLRPLCRIGWEFCTTPCQLFPSVSLHRGPSRVQQQRLQGLLRSRQRQSKKFSTPPSYVSTIVPTFPLMSMVPLPLFSFS